MTTVLLVIHVMIAAALIGVVLLQRSEGGALGIGGGGGGFMTGRSAGNALTKTTAVLAAMFFATSLALTLVASHQRLRRRSSTRGPAVGGEGRCLASCFLRLLRRRQAPPAPQAPQSSNPQSPLIGNGAISPRPFAARFPRLVDGLTFGLRLSRFQYMFEAHGAVRLHYRRRGLLSRQGAGIGRARCGAAGARLSASACASSIPISTSIRGR